MSSRWQAWRKGFKRRGGSSNHGIAGSIVPGTINGWQWIPADPGWYACYRGIDSHRRSIPAFRLLLATGCL